MCLFEYYRFLYDDSPVLVLQNLMHHNALQSGNNMVRGTLPFWSPRRKHRDQIITMMPKMHSLWIGRRPRQALIIVLKYGPNFFVIELFKIKMLYHGIAKTHLPLYYP